MDAVPPVLELTSRNEGSIMPGGTTSDHDSVLWCDVISLDLLFLPCQSPCNEAYTVKNKEREERRNFFIISFCS